MKTNFNLQLFAKTWKPGEAARAILSGDQEAILDIGKRFPMFTVAVASGKVESFLNILDSLPDYVSARQIDSRLRGGAAESEDSEDSAEEAPEVPAKAEKAEKPSAKKAEKKEDPYAGKTAKELFAICKERKIKVEPKQPADVYLKALDKADAAKAKAAAKPAPKKDEDEDWGEEKPAKEEKKAAKKDEEEDWDI